MTVNQLLESASARELGEWMALSLYESRQTQQQDDEADLRKTFSNPNAR
jgi:hypothetical protein